MAFLNLILSSLISLNANASFSKANDIFSHGLSSESNVKTLAKELEKEGFYFSLVPWLKETIVSKEGRLSKDFDEILDEVILKVGLEQFETMQATMLSRSSSSLIKYILAKKKVNAMDFKGALDTISGVSDESSIYPFALNLKGTVLSALSDHSKALKAFEECVDESQSKFKKEKNDAKKKQLSMNRDYCTAGIARVYYAKKDYTKADLKYLDVPKESMVWPEILFEEAWNSFYLENYNRTLGKLVTYKAPVLEFIFNPEIDVLRSFTYFKMCLWEDSKKAADEFQKQFLESAKEVRLLLLEKSKDYEWFFHVGLGAKTVNTRSSLLNLMLHSISKEPALRDLKDAINHATDEYQKIKNLPNTKLKNAMIKNLGDVMTLQRRTFGGFVKKRLINKYAILFNAFQDLSFIKLEILEKKKQDILSDRTETGKRGDIKYIKRNEKQYFWSFNGEFWADELGDYVFALRSECN